MRKTARHAVEPLPSPSPPAALRRYAAESLTLSRPCLMPDRATISPQWARDHARNEAAALIGDEIPPPRPPDLTAARHWSPVALVPSPDVAAVIVGPVALSPDVAPPS